MKHKLRKLFRDNYFKAAFGLFIVGVLLRFYRLSEFVTLLGDQGRDAIIIRRILTLEHLPAIGPTTSIGQIYLGPFYYYFIAPWLLLTNFNPVGLAIGVAVFSSLFILIAYFVGSDLFDKKVGLIFASFITFSAVLIDFSRYSWNPNLLPLFTLLIFYFVIKAVKTGQRWFYILAGAFLSFLIQLHYIALCLVPAVGLYMLVEYFRVRPKLIETVKNWVVMVATFVFFTSPLIIFDLRHDFLNSRNFFTLFFKTGAVRSHRIDDLLETFGRLTEITFSLQLQSMYIIIFLILLSVVGIVFLKKNKNLRALSIFFFVSLIVTSAYSGIKHPHYLGVLYPFYYLFVGYVLTTVFNSKRSIPILIIFLFLFTGAQVRNYYFLFQNGGYQIEKAQRIAKVIFDNVDKSKYQLTGLPDKYSDSSYRYFLELWGRRPLEHDTLDRADELFVLCEKECKIIGDPQWEIAYFAPTKVIKEWNVEGIKVYKLIH